MTNPQKDRHVLAAAVTAGANIIVTHNLADFPASSQDPYGIVAQTPDEFLIDLYTSSPYTMVRLLQEQAAFLRSPRMSVEQVLDALAQQQVPHFAALMKKRVEKLT